MSLQLRNLKLFLRVGSKHDVLKDTEVFVYLVQVVDFYLEVIVVYVSVTGILALSDFERSQLTS